MSLPRNIRESVALTFASVLVAALIGCNSGARRDVYQQKMAGEIRILEDQLYEADYHNRVLNDQLERCRVKVNSTDEPDDPVRSQSISNHSARSPKSSASTPLQDPITDSLDPNNPSDAPTEWEGEIDMDAGLESEGLELPSVDFGEPVSPESIPNDSIPNDSIPNDSIPSDSKSSESKPSGSKLGTAPPIEPIPLSDKGAQELPAPGGPEPPGKEDTEIPPVDPGQILPPPVGGAEEDADRPGQIILPDSLNRDAGIPEQLKIHAGLSSGIEGDDEQNEMTIVINVVDNLGQIVDLGKFDIDAKLSIVLLDPARDSDQSRIGRWDFSREEVAKLIQREPVSAIRVPVQWMGDRPAGKEVVVHARLRAEEDDMRCERRLVVDKKQAIAEWMPRGQDVRR